LIPVPQDFIGHHPVSQPISDPYPFNHSTKIAILDVRRKQFQPEKLVSETQPSQGLSGMGI
jgi:hypothetical protein